MTADELREKVRAEGYRAGLDDALKIAVAAFAVDDDLATAIAKIGRALQDDELHALMPGKGEG